MFKKIFIALETKPADHEILSCMGGLRSLLGAREAHLVYIDQERLNNLQQRLAAKTGIEINTILRYGMPASELLKVEQEICPSLVLMGSQGRGLSRRCFWTVSATPWLAGERPTCCWSLRPYNRRYIVSAAIKAMKPLG